MVLKLALLHIIIITISNALVSIPLEIWGLKMTWAAFTYPLIVVITDLTVRKLGKHVAARTIYRAFPFAIVMSILIVFLEKNQLGFAFRIGLASACAYGIGTLIDVHVFQKIRERCDAWWIAPSLSTVVANVIDTYSFFAVAFLNSANPYMSSHWVEIATTLTLTKIVIGLLLFLPLYGMVLKRLNYIADKNV